MNLENRVVVITGATGGLGRVVARNLSEGGTRLAIIGRNSATLENLAGEIGLAETHYLAHSVDLGDPGAVQDAAKAIVSKFGRVDALLHLVGGWKGGKSVVASDPKDLADMLHQHAWTTFYTTRAFIPHLVENGWGRIVVVSSPYVAAPLPKGASYAMGKAAQEALILTLAQELKGTGVTANILLVKNINLKGARDNTPSSKNQDGTTPTEIIGTIRYLCSEDAQQVNGARLPLYGGP